MPFSVNLTTKIDTNSVDFEVEDFTYEIVDSDTLKVNIEYSINAVEMEEELFKPTEDDKSFDELLDDIDLELDERKEESNNISEEVKEENIDNEITDVEQNTVLDSISKEDSFVTYHIHVMKETDTIESICTKYNTSSSLLEEYNDLSTLSVGEKILIPDVNE